MSEHATILFMNIPSPFHYRIEVLFRCI